ncbi:MAG: hypothetical protein QXW97_02450 [Candidatus Pacearchaeota archaeon]
MRIKKKNLKYQYFKLYFIFLIGIIMLIFLVSSVLSNEQILCNKDSDCGFVHFVGNEYCLDNDVVKDKIFPTCINNLCVEIRSQEIIINCQDIYGEWGQYYCKYNNSYRSRIVVNSFCTIFDNGLAGCNNSNLYIQEEKVEECVYGCDEITGRCKIVNIKCKNNSDCGITGFIGNPFCIGKDLFKYFQNSTCLNPNTFESECKISKEPVIFVDCGEDYCDDFGSNYCKGKDVYKSRICYERGCSIDSCFARSNVNEILVKTCEFGCLNNDCVEDYQKICNFDSDCGKDSYIDDKYCKNNDVYQNYIKYSCINPGTNESLCNYEIIQKLIEKCIRGCKDGKCKKISDVDKPFREFDEINFTLAKIYYTDTISGNYSFFKINKTAQKLISHEINKSRPVISLNTLVIILIILIIVITILIIILYLLK